MGWKFGRVMCVYVCRVVCSRSVAESPTSLGKIEKEVGSITLDGGCQNDDQHRTRCRDARINWGGGGGGGSGGGGGGSGGGFGRVVSWLHFSAPPKTFQQEHIGSTHGMFNFLLFR